MGLFNACKGWSWLFHDWGLSENDSLSFRVQRMEVNWIFWGCLFNIFIINGRLNQKFYENNSLAFKVHSMTLAFLWIIERIIRFDEYWERRCHFKSRNLTIVLLRSLGSAPSPITLKNKKLDSSQTTFNLNQGGTLENIKLDSSPITLKTKTCFQKTIP